MSGWRDHVQPPVTLSEAQQAELKLRELKRSHAFYCDQCIHVKRCLSPDCRQVCGIAQVYDKSIAAVAVLVETAKVVDGDGPA